MHAFRPLVLLLLLSTVGAQVARDTSLQITIVLDGEREPTSKELTVTLMNEWSEVEAVQTTNRGMLSMLTSFGIKRIRITGHDIEQFDTEFMLENPADGQQTFVVSPRMTARKPAANHPASIAAVRLNIPKKAQKRWEKAEKELRKQNWLEARAHYEEAVKLYPSFDLAYYGLAKVALAMGDTQAAKTHLARAVQLNDAFTDASRKLADLLITENRIVDAEPLLRRTLELEPTDPWTLTALAMAELTQAKLGDAVAHAQKVHLLPHKGFATAHLIAARGLEASGKPAEAIAEYRLYLEEDPRGSHVTSAREALARLGATGSPD